MTVIRTTRAGPDGPYSLVPRTALRSFATVALTLAAWLCSSVAWAQDGGLHPDALIVDPYVPDGSCVGGVCADVRTPDVVGPRCGDGSCNGSETCSTCSSDCGTCPSPDAGGPRCGDGSCNGSETCSTCSSDCGRCPSPDAGGPRCGDGSCNGSETCSTCSSDCGRCPSPDAGGPRCGDGVCSTGETCSSCAMDCGACRVCGDGICSASETCSSCAIDCRPCPVPDSGVPDVAIVDVHVPDAGVDVRPPDVEVDGGTPDVSTRDVLERDVVTMVDVPPLPDARPPVDVPPTMDRPTTVDVPSMDVAMDRPSVDRPDADVPTVDMPTSDHGDDVPTEDAVDAGDGGCFRPPRLRATLTSSVRWNIEPPEVLGTGARLTAMASFSSMAGVSGTMCRVGFSARGGGMACGGVLGQRVCVALNVGGGGSCEMPLVCEMPPVPTCDTNRACCTKTAMASATVSRTWRQRTGFGPFTCQVSIGGSVGASVTGENRSGPGCMPCMDETSVTGRVTLGANGGAGCSITVFGYEVTVGATAAACANGGIRGTIGCGADVGPVGGASFSISVPRITVGWFTVGPFNRKWEVGSGC